MGSQIRVFKEFLPRLINPTVLCTDGDDLAITHSMGNDVGMFHCRTKTTWWWCWWWWWLLNEGKAGALWEDLRLRIGWRAPLSYISSAFRTRVLQCLLLYRRYHNTRRLHAHSDVQTPDDARRRPGRTI